MNQEQQQIKICIIGSSNVGKTSLLLKYTESQFESNYQATIGIDFKFKILQIGEQKFRLALWDTAGQEKFQTITRSFYQNTHAFVFVFDLSKQESLKRLRDFWIPQVLENIHSHFIGFLIGNKRDLKSDDSTADLVQELMNQFKLRYYETSCKLDQNIDVIF